jgi:carbon starvation protein CstA
MQCPWSDRCWPASSVTSPGLCGWWWALSWPVWLLLSPRDYLSSIMKLGVIALLAVGIIIVMPDLKMPAFTSFIHGGGPIIPGTLFPYLFILTTIDAGTRVARFILQELLGKFYKPFRQANWLPGNLVCSGLVVVCWGWFVYSGTVSTIWPMFGTANQLLATIALAIGTSYLINRGKAKYAWITLVPLAFVGITTMTAGVMNIWGIYIPQIGIPKNQLQGIINLGLTLVIMACMAIIIKDAIPAWLKAIRKSKF